MPTPNRRSFLKTSAVAAVGTALPLWGCASEDDPDTSTRETPSMTTPLYQISLAEWSLHRSLFEGDLDHLDFARKAREWFNIGAVEYVNQFFMDRATDQQYLQRMKTRAEDAGVQSLLIMCDNEGALGHPDSAERTTAVENHHKWIEAASFLGCHSVRVNAEPLGEGSRTERQKRAADGLRRLTEFAAEREINVLVENHGGLSSDGEWLAGVMDTVNHERCGTLPDFGNWQIRKGNPYDPYEGVRELMPYAKAISAKSYAFDDQGRETTLDYTKLMRIVLDAGYRGHVGIEYEGDGLSEREGIWTTKQLLVDVREQLNQQNK